jgi:hypothetical protein
MSRKLLPAPVHGQDDRCYRHGCRRTECRDAYRNARKRAQLRRHRGIPDQIPGNPIAEHLQTVLASGKTRLQIAAESGVSDRAIRYILAGQPEIQRAKAAALLAVQPHPASLRVPTTGALRRIQALACIGWPVTRTADEAGASRGYVFNILRGQVTDIDRALDDRITAFYRAKSTQPGPSVFTRNNAARRGWAGPLAWDGNINDPTAQPDIADVPDPELKRDELAALRRDEIWLLHTACHGDEEIAARVGMSPSSVTAIRQELRTGKKRDRTKKQEVAA